jgi:hypothetical protein
MHADACARAPPARSHRDDLKSFNTQLSADEGVPAIGEGQLEFSLKLFDLNQVGAGG